ncbi:AraC family transcriptional regulator [Cohnella ginsengisoli]|uniref:AraC family transcriptional regulator n=1 Tax=Cohnella ginsengisoli TaxID=425004 RepID=A0A9X4KGX0_9BACL|nr:AraC family transcriptional regulator [Cohnella ginsengisoli]MDG0791304.1 AraC family transcriptional regulator [Cohnella ginsengisoli]
MNIRDYELIRHDSVRSPASMYRTGGIHPSYEMLCLLSGDYRLNWLGDAYEIRPPSLFIFTPNTPHDLAVLSDRAIYWYIDLTGLEDHPEWSKLQNVLFWNRLQSGLDPAYSLSPVMRLCFDAIVNLLELPNQDAALVKRMLLLDVEKMVWLVQHTLRAYEGKLKNKQSSTLPPGYELNKDVIHTLALYLESNYKRKITLRDLSAISNFQSTYLIKRFKEETGYTPIEYLLELRMEAAKTYLSFTSMPIQTVAAESGFSNIHHFSGEFKRKTGLSPSDWRNGHRPDASGTKIL